MATARQVMLMLRPNDSWVMKGEEYEGLEILSGNPLTKKEFQDGFAQYDAWKADQEAKIQSEKKALLAKLGITEEEAKLLLS